MVIDIRACGVCRSDHHAWSGADPDVALPHVMGHELAGVVAEVGPECRRFSVGDRVTAPFILSCGSCTACNAGQPTTCETQDVIGFTQWGAFAEFTAISNADFNLVPLPDDLDFVDAAAMGCRLTTAWRAVVDRAQTQAGEWMVVHGAGGVGLSAILIAKALDIRTVAVDLSAEALSMAALLGAEVTIDVGAVDDVGAAVRDVTSGGAHVSIDALGIAATFENSLRSLRKLGRHVQVGMPVGDHEVVDLPLLELVYSRQLSLHGMRGLGASGFADLVKLCAGGQLDPGALVNNRITLSDVGNSLALMDGVQPPGITVIDRMNH